MSDGRMMLTVENSWLQVKLRVYVIPVSKTFKEEAEIELDCRGRVLAVKVVLPDIMA